MAAYSNFRSSNEIENDKEAIREARKTILEKAKYEFEKSERKKQKAEASGEGSWMLDSVISRIDKEQKALEKVKQKKKKKKTKKEKKKKKYSDSSDKEDAWVEKPSDARLSVTSGKPVSGPTLQRDSWMVDPRVTDIIPTVTRDELRDRKRGEEDKKKAEAVKLLEQPGQHSRELNPYWKDGGTGVPEKAVSASFTIPVAASGDGGLSWLRKAYDRCKQQAQDESRPLEDIAAERYGSLEKLLSMIKEAENRTQTSASRQKDRYSTGRDHSRERDYRVDDRDRKNERDGKRRRNDDSKDVGQSGRDREVAGHGDSRTREDVSPAERAARDSDVRPKELCRVRDSHSSTDIRRFLPPSSDEKRQQRFIKPEEDAETSRTGVSASSAASRRFAKPAESGDDESWKRNLSSSSYKGTLNREQIKSGGGGGGWRKPETREQAQVGHSSTSRLTEKYHKRSKSDASSSSSDSSSSSSSDEENSEEKSVKENQASQPEPTKLLSENELNALGAKILRAELMGDLELAAQLKAQLEEARKVRSTVPAVPMVKDTNQKADSRDESVVVLTRTGRDGMVRPLPEQEYDRDRSSRKRRKMKKVETHEKGGERSRYFDDDDRHDLKKLVEMEKLGTAEDQNSMFARLAGRNTEKTDDDFQVDDMFVSRAAQQQCGARNEEKERSKAIFEHRKVSASMEKCQFCFNKVPKHLIIAIGSKAYLSLPGHKSLTPGHCLIVPMQHSPSATALDEDVWQEIQTFRKQLVQMFESQGEDVVFMETSMYLKHFPHMVLECIPLEREIGDMAPIYFKKALQEAGPEWSHNKKVVDLSQKDIRHAVPKSFPYFSVDFGLQGGFAHVIEDEQKFPSYFGREIVGGMIDAEPGLWRKPRKEPFEEQRRKVLEFEQWWKPFDFTSK